ncbi:MAG: electron transporter RnfD [Candidatus Cloacimonetes bacterium 4572_65]|nr:MAG: electron transporter RnfD [Candidatus Cloacimonetes bacterium 4572_65]
MSKQIYTVSPAPHLHKHTSTSQIMWLVVIALMPALAVGTYYFGIRALILTLLGGVAAMICEALIQKFRKVPLSVMDGSAFLTGILVSFNIHANAPMWLPIVGSVFAIAIGKQVFGGLGNNILNPALLGRAFLLASWPTLMTDGWSHTIKNSISGISESTITQVQGLSQIAYTKVTSATPLNVIKAIRDTSMFSDAADASQVQQTIFNGLIDWSSLKNLFLGNVGGCIGEVSALALLIGGLFLLHKKIIDWRIPFTYIGSVFLLSWMFGGMNGLFSAGIQLPLFHILSGGVMLGAFFMATDYVSTPVTKNGRIYFGLGCGLITVTIRLVGGYPEGVSYSILLMNLVTPLIDRWTMPKAFGEVKK